MMDVSTSYLVEIICVSFALGVNFAHLLFLVINWSTTGTTVKITTAVMTLGCLAGLVWLTFGGR